MTCKWCGDDHGVEQLCGRGQRAMSRRSFLFLTGAGVAGLVLAPSLPEVMQFQYRVVFGQFTIANPGVGQLVAEAWNRIVGDGPHDNIFTDHHFARLMRDELNASMKGKP